MLDGKCIGCNNIVIDHVDNYGNDIVGVMCRKCCQSIIESNKEYDIDENVIRNIIRGQSYIPFDHLNSIQKEAVIELFTKHKVPVGCRIKIVDQYTDNNSDNKLQCIDVKFTTWKCDIVKCSFLSLTDEQVAAFHYPEDPRASATLKVLINNQKERNNR